MSKKIKRFSAFSLLLLVSISLLFSAKVLFAQEDSSKQALVTEPTEQAQNKDEQGEKEHEKSEKFNAGELIIEHISDAHDWHLWGHTAIPLPIILYSSKGLDVFLSSVFEHGNATYHGKQNYKLVKGHIKVVNENEEIDEAATASTYDISITKNVLSIFMTIGLMIWIFLSIAKSYTKKPGQAPKGMQSLFEPIIIFVRDEIAKPSIGEKKHGNYLPFLLTVFFFIWISNLLGLIPIVGGANVTGNIAVALVLAALVFIITVVSGNKHYWRHIFAMPGVPSWVLFILTPIEIISLFLKPFVLMIRLFANILAGHIIALSFFSLIFIFAEMNAGLGYGVSVLSIVFTVFMGMLELLVAFLQAYVFTLLTAMYFGSAVEEHHHEESH